MRHDFTVHSTNSALSIEKIHRASGEMKFSNLNGSCRCANGNQIVVVLREFATHDFFVYSVVVCDLTKNYKQLMLLQWAINKTHTYIHEAKTTSIAKGNDKHPLLWKMSIRPNLGIKYKIVWQLTEIWREMDSTFLPSPYHHVNTL